MNRGRQTSVADQLALAARNEEKGNHRQTYSPQLLNRFQVCVWHATLRTVARTCETNCDRERCCGSLVRSTFIATSSDTREENNFTSFGAVEFDNFLQIFNLHLLFFTEPQAHKPQAVYKPNLNVT